jgi:hypothetical protein
MAGERERLVRVREPWKGKAGEERIRIVCVICTIRTVCAVRVVCAVNRLFISSVVAIIN